MRKHVYFALLKFYKRNMFQRTAKWLGHV